jgi:hypothetical protein
MKCQLSRVDPYSYLIPMDPYSYGGNFGAEAGEEIGVRTRHT